MQILRGGLPDARAAFTAFAHVEDRHAHVMVNVDLSALAGGHAEVVGITNVDSYALGWMNVLTHSVLLSGYTYIISTRKG